MITLSIYFISLGFGFLGVGKVWQMIFLSNLAKPASTEPPTLDKSMQDAFVTFKHFIMITGLIIFGALSLIIGIVLGLIKVCIG